MVLGSQRHTSMGNLQVLLANPPRGEMRNTFSVLWRVQQSLLPKSPLCRCHKILRPSQPTLCSGAPHQRYVPGRDMSAFRQNQEEKGNSQGIPATCDEEA